MDEESSDVNALVPLPRPGAAHAGDAHTAVAHADSDDLGVEIDGIRSRLGDLIGELDRRRSQAFDLRRQLRLHPVPFMVAAVVVVGAVAGTIVAGVARHRRRGLVLPPSRRIWHLLQQLGGAPERQGPSRSRATRRAKAGTRIAIGLAAAFLRTFARRLATQVIAPPHA